MSSTKDLTEMEFRECVKDIFRASGLVVNDIPISNDRGADFVIRSNNYKYAVRCKTCFEVIGADTVQEIIKSMNHYACNYGIVVSNCNFFTSVARNKADENGILLVNGQEIETFAKNPENIKKYLSGFEGNTVFCQPDLADAEEYWVVKDLSIRYGVSEDNVYQKYMYGGLPYYKVNGEYRFNPEEVIAWEMEIRHIPKKHHWNKGLPEFNKYRNELCCQLQYARKEKDREKVRQLKKMMKEEGIRIPWSPLAKTALTCILVSLVILIISYIATLWYYYIRETKQILDGLLNMSGITYSEFLQQFQNISNIYDIWN